MIQQVLGIYILVHLPWQKWWWQSIKSNNNRAGTSDCPIRLKYCCRASYIAIPTIISISTAVEWLLTMQYSSYLIHFGKLFIHGCNYSRILTSYLFMYSPWYIGPTSAGEPMKRNVMLSKRIPISKINSTHTLICFCFSMFAVEVSGLDPINLFWNFTWTSGWITTSTLFAAPGSSEVPKYVFHFLMRRNYFIFGLRSCTWHTSTKKSRTQVSLIFNGAHGEKSNTDVLVHHFTGQRSG